MTYAILQHGGRQYRVTAGDRLLVDRLAADVGTMVALEPVLLTGDGDTTDVGTPGVDGVRVAALVVAHRRGKKLRVFKYKPKKRFRKTIGFRADLTELRVQNVLAKGAAVPDPPEVGPKPTAKSKPSKSERPKPARATRAKRDAASTGAEVSLAKDDEPEAEAEAEVTKKDSEASKRRQRVEKSRAADTAKRAAPAPKASAKRAKPATDEPVADGPTKEAGGDGP